MQVQLDLDILKKAMMEAAHESFEIQKRECVTMESVALAFKKHGLPVEISYPFYLACHWWGDLEAWMDDPYSFARWVENGFKFEEDKDAPDKDAFDEDECENPFE